MALKQLQDKGNSDKRHEDVLELRQWQGKLQIQ